MIDTVVSNIGLPWTNRHTSHEQTDKEIRANDGSERHLARICADHWYTSERIWRLANHDPGPGFAETFPRYAPWYRTELTKSDPACLAEPSPSALLPFPSQVSQQP
jgi:hypothetical protein